MDFKAQPGGLNKILQAVEKHFIHEETAGRKRRCGNVETTEWKTEYDMTTMKGCKNKSQRAMPRIVQEVGHFYLKKPL